MHLHHNHPRVHYFSVAIEVNFGELTSTHLLVISGEYGQLGHQTLISTDEPRRVEFFKEQRFHVVHVVCGPWNTFTAVAKEEIT